MFDKALVSGNLSTPAGAIDLTERMDLQDEESQDVQQQEDGRPERRERGVGPLLQTSMADHISVPTSLLWTSGLHQHVKRLPQLLFLPYHR